MQWKELDPEGRGFRDTIPDPGCQSLIGVTTNGTVHFLSPSNGAILHSIQVPETNFTIWSVSPDHRWLLGWSSDRTAGLLCDLRGSPKVQRISDFYPVGSFPACSPDNRLLAYATTNFVIKLRDLVANREKVILKEPGWWLYSLAFLPDGKWLASGGADGNAWLWSCRVVFKPGIFCS
jgi:WD40 repeat protein